MKRRTRNAFTILEMLFALVLFAIMMSACYGCFIYAARTISRCQEGFAPFREGIKVQKVLQRMLASASATKQRNPKATFEGEAARLSFTTLNRQGFDPAHPWPLAYVRIAHDRDEGLSIISHPTWFLLDKDDPTNGTKFVFPSVRSLKLEYRDGKDFARDWDATKKGKLPGAVRVHVEIEGPNKKPLVWTFLVPLPIQAELPVVSGVPGGAPGGVPGAAGVPMFGNPGLPAPFNPAAPLQPGGPRFTPTTGGPR